MRKIAKLSFIVIFLSTILFCFISSVSAGDYPDKPIKLNVTYSPGGATDFQARLVTMLAQKYLGQPVAVINKPGGGGMVGWNWFVKSADKDGYELVTYNVPHFVAQSIVYSDKAQYSIRNLEPIANWGTDPAVLAVPADSPFNSVDDLVEFAKKNPGSVTISGAGLYVGHHIAMLQFENAAGVDLSYIPYSGGAPALLGIVSGEVMAGFNNLSDAFRSKDRLKILAVADIQRSIFLPDLFTFRELGFDVDDTSSNMRGIAVPKGTDPKIITFLSEQFVQMFNDKKIVKKMYDTGCGVKVMNREELLQKWPEIEKSLQNVLK